MNTEDAATRPVRALRAVATAVGLLALSWYVRGKLIPADRWKVSVFTHLGESLGLAAVFVLACLSTGALIVRAASAGRRRDGAWALSFSVGTLVFSLAIGVLGGLGLLTPGMFFFLPLVMFAVGIPALVSELHERRASPEEPIDLLDGLLIGAGAIALGLVAFQALNPENVNYDTRWYHFRVAERYALAERFVRFPEGDYLAVLPQAATWLWTWAFTRPYVLLHDRAQLALLMEVTTVVGALALVPPLARALLPTLTPKQTRLAWVAFFLFPSVLIYDTAVMGGADHVAALWAAAMLLTWLQARQRGDRRSWALFGLTLAGALAKYTSLYLVLPLVAVVVLDAAVRARRAPGARTPIVLAPLLAGAVTVVLTAPHWLRNLIHYRNPVYPLLGSVFPSTPWNEDGPAWLHRMSLATVEFSNHGTAANTASRTLESLYSYAYEPFTWGDFVGGQGVFGFAYLLSLVPLPFIRGRRLWVIAAIVHAGIAFWFNVNHQMRYLTIFVPIMAAAVAAVCAHVWSWRSWLVRGALFAVVGLHAVAFFDVPFRRTHRIGGSSATERSIDYLVRTGEKYKPYPFWDGVALPPRAVPLVHGVSPMLGIGRQSVTDVPGLQFGLNYGRLGSVPAIHQRLRSMGVTHVLWQAKAEQPDSIAGEALFAGLASTTVNRKQHKGWWIGELPAEPETGSPVGDGLLYVGCASIVETGLYKLSDLAEPMREQWAWVKWPKPRATAADWKTLLPRATFVVQEEGCGLNGPGDFAQYGTQTGHHRELRYYVRSTGRAELANW